MNAYTTSIKHFRALLIKWELTFIYLFLKFYFKYFTILY